MTSNATDCNCEALLLEYAAGTLDDAHMLMMATYLTLSPEGRRYVRDCELLGGALMAHVCDPVDIGSACLEQLLEKIEYAEAPCAERKSCCNQTCIPCDDILPAPLAGLLPPDMAEILVWKRAFGGLSWIEIPLPGCSSHAQLMRCAPGFTIPRHRHRGPEITLVLEGALSDAHGRYTRGDMMIAGDGTAHRPIADATTGCLCFCVTTHPVRFSGFLARLRLGLSGRSFF